LLFRLQKKIGLLAATALLFPTLALQARAGSLEAIQSKIAQFLQRPGNRATDWGIEILDPTANKVLLAVNADKTFQPASVVKVITTAAALEKLGPDFRFKTRVFTNGAVLPDGTVAGDLILVGRGDPNLDDPYRELMNKPALQDLAEKLHAAGIRRVRGNVIGDDSYFDSAYSKGWTAQDLRSVYGAPISALTINNNVFWVSARATKANKLVSVSVYPETSYFRISNKGVTGARRSRRTLHARLLPGTRTIALSGVLPARQSFSQYILLEKPAEVAAAMFKEHLQKQGIAATGQVESVRRGELPQSARASWRMLAEYESVPLIRALEIINKRSQNLHAEMLLRTLGAEFRGQGTDSAGIEVVEDFLVESGIEIDKVRLNDGSGLSRNNLVTPRFQTALLKYLLTRPYFDLFLNTLAVSGTDGTLKHRLASREMKGSIHAKTGTLRGVSNLSGYMTTKSGHNLVFSIFTSKSTGRVKRTIDEICSLFVNLY
jgi:D-alanyl-D-alanine carboxypeptidase/D-alanyl-D-alanine-endopeptidase (penicillin-binding protein 4)